MTELPKEMKEVIRKAAGLLPGKAWSGKISIWPLRNLHHQRLIGENSKQTREENGGDLSEELFEARRLWKRKDFPAASERNGRT